MFFRKRKARREPALGTFGTLFAFGLNARDRIGSSGNGAARVAPAHRTEHKKSPRGKKPRRGKLRRLLYWCFVLAIWAGLALIGFVGYQASRLPPLATLVVPKRPPNIAILGIDGKLIATRGDMGGGGAARATSALSAAGLHRHRGPPLLLAFRHRSDRPRARARVRNLTRAASSQGGSTLTQQLAKNLFLTQERTISRKVQEVILALWLERKLFEGPDPRTLSQPGLFRRRRLWRRAAAQRYFGKSARDGDAGRSRDARGPRARRRRGSRRRAIPRPPRERAELVLAAHGRRGLHLRRHGAQRALTPAGDRAGKRRRRLDRLRRRLGDGRARRLRRRAREDIVVETTIDPALQAAAEKALAEELAKQGDQARRHPGRARRHRSGRRACERWSAAATMPRASSIAPSPRKRQPGSAFKPFVYLAALERGLTPETRA